MKRSKKQSLLWKVEGPNLVGTSYLFGTMHIKSNKAFKNKELVYEKIHSCEAFATEFDLDEMNQPKDPGFFLLPFGQRLDQLMPLKKYAKLRTIIGKVAGLDLNHFRHLQPLVISNLVDETILSADMPLALDAHLWKFAQQSAKKTIGIETFAEQIRIFKQIPLKYQVESLLAMGKNINRHRQHLLRLTEMYERQDIAQLHKTARKGGGKLKYLLIDGRNTIMANRLWEQFQKQSLLFAVGAGHLGGKNGLLRLLKLRGLKVKPVY